MARPAGAPERCELCAEELAQAHRHVVEVANGKIACVCAACALRFPPSLAGRYKTIPRDARILEEFQLSDEQWESLALPINMAFIFKRSPENKPRAMYPSPGGATESLLSLSCWEALDRENPALSAMETDVEALLVNRIGEAKEYFLAPIDVCYELTGLIRLRWKGFSGGDEVWRAIEEFFGRLKEQARRWEPAEEVARA
jgi:hypothetical protein